jgi:Rod binding domain-containing protein
MTDGTAINSMQNGLLDAQAARLIQRVQSGSSAGAGAAHSKQDAKIEKSSKDFESILLSSWLQGAEGSFAKVPGGDDDDDEDSGMDQFQGIAMQALAGSMAANGGIGIAKMIAQSLRATEQAAPGETNRE